MSILKEVSVYVCTYVGDNLKVFERAWASYPDFNEFCLKEVLRVFKPHSVAPCSTPLPPKSPLLKCKKNFGEVKGGIK